MKKIISTVCLLGLITFNYALADETAHHDKKSEKAEHAVCSDHDQHCKSEEAGIEQIEHKYCEGHKEHCKKHGEQKSKKKDASH